MKGKYSYCDLPLLVHPSRSACTLQARKLVPKVVQYMEMPSFYLLSQRRPFHTQNLYHPCHPTSILEQDCRQPRDNFATCVTLSCLSHCNPLPTRVLCDTCWFDAPRPVRLISTQVSCSMLQIRSDLNERYNQASLIDIPRASPRQVTMLRGIVPQPRKSPKIGRAHV